MKVAEKIDEVLECPACRHKEKSNRFNGLNCPECGTPLKIKRDIKNNKQ